MRIPKLGLSFLREVYDWVCHDVYGRACEGVYVYGRACEGVYGKFFFLEFTRPKGT